MVVLLFERVRPALRGQLSRWMIEPQTNVFVGQVSAMVRDKLWQMVCKGTHDGAATMIYSSPTEQGFSIQCFGDPTRSITDWEGLTLVHIPKATRQGVKSTLEAHQTDTNPKP